MQWLELIRGAPQGQTFYAYTKEVSRFQRLVEPNCPANFKFVYSLGGKEDHLIIKELDRHADVFPDTSSLEAAGYSSQEASDLLAVFGPPEWAWRRTAPERGSRTTPSASSKRSTTSRRPHDAPAPAPRPAATAADSGPVAPAGAHRFGSGLSGGCCGP